MTYFLNLLKKGTILVTFAGILFTSCVPPAAPIQKAIAKIELRPDLSTEDIEIWFVYGVGNSYASYEDVDEAMKKTAAEKSEAEGYDCFFLHEAYYKTNHYSETYKRTKTMHGQANTYGSANYQSNHYNNNWGYGSTQGNINSYGTTDYSYEVPDTYTHNHSKPNARWQVSFKKADVCEQAKKSKWRERVYYNRDYLEQPSFR